MSFLSRVAVAAAMIGTLYSFQRPFREFPGVEYRIGDIPSRPTTWKKPNGPSPA